MPGVMQPLYADNMGELGTFGKIEHNFNRQTQAVMERGYYTEPTKSY